MARRNIPEDIGEYLGSSCRHTCEEGSIEDFLSASGNAIDAELIAEQVDDYIAAGDLDISLYRLDLVSSERDPLYDEFISRVYSGPYVIRGLVKVPERQVDADSNGLSSTIDMSITVSRLSVERAGLGEPQIGDIIGFWLDVPYWNRYASNDEVISSSGHFYEVQQITPDGVIRSGPEFTSFRLDVRRNTVFSPERKVVEG